MTKKTKIIFFSILFIQVLIIISITLYISSKHNLISISPSKKEYLIFPTRNFFNLKHFYEPKPDSVRIDKPEWLPYTATYTINKDSLNERFDYPIKKDPDVYRIVAIGDSFTFGSFVNTADNWPEKLEDLFQASSFCKKYKKIEVINLSVYAYDIEYAISRLKLRGMKYDPDMVLWFIKNDDFLINIEIMKPSFDKFRKEFTAKIPLAPNDHSWATKAIMDANEKYGENTILNHQIEIMRSIADTFKGKLVLLTFQQTKEIYKNILINFKKYRPRTFFYGNLPNIYAPGTPNAPLLNGDPSVEGHGLIASTIFEYLKTNKIIPCRKLLKLKNFLLLNNPF